MNWFKLPFIIIIIDVFWRTLIDQMKHFNKTNDNLLMIKCDLIILIWIIY